MAVPQTKDELLAAITLEFGKLRKALDDIPEGIVHARTMEGHAKGTMMPVRSRRLPDRLERTRAEMAGS